MRCHTLFRDGSYTWRVFSEDKTRSRSPERPHPVAVSVGQSVVLIDPGSSEVFPSLLAAMASELVIEQIENVIFTHQNPGVGSGLPLWREICRQPVAFHVPALWADGLSHLDADAALVPIPDSGTGLRFGDHGHLRLIPAHHLFSAANFSVYDPTARILFSGPIGASAAMSPSADLFVADVASHAKTLSASHERRIASAAARDAWINRVRELDIDMIVPSYGPIYSGAATSDFLDWFGSLSLGSPESFTYNEDLGSAPPLADDTGEMGAPEIPGTTPEPDAPALSAEAAIALSENLGGPENSAAATPADDPSPDAPSDVIEPPITHTGGPVLAQELRDEGRMFRLVTRSDFDGLVCAVLLEELDLIDDILFAHPWEVQARQVPLDKNDISTNLPYDPRVYLAFDHHLSETARVGDGHANHIIDATAPSAARVVYNYFGGPTVFPDISEEMMSAVDKADSAQFSREDVLNPIGWELLNFVMDPRTGLGRFHGFRIPNYELMMSLIEDIRTHPIDEILKLTDVKERVDLCRQHRPFFEDQLQRCTTVHGNLAVIDMRGEQTLYTGNRFLIYAMFPEINVSMHVLWGKQQQNTVFAVGKSIFDRTSAVDVGALMLEYGGGGHRAAGTCQSENDMAEDVCAALIKRLTAA